MTKIKYRDSHLDSSQIELPSAELSEPKTVLRRIRNYLAGQVVGATRDEAFLEEILKCAYCRLHLEKVGKATQPSAECSAKEITGTYNATLGEIQLRFPRLFSNSKSIDLPSSAIQYVDHEFSLINLSTAHDIVGDVYEAFIGNSYRGQEGQFFTPRVAVKALVDLTAPTSEDLIIDPACGSGGFLLEAARTINNAEAVNPEQIHGVDKDSDLTHLAQLHMAIQFDSAFPINCADSLLWGGNGFEKSKTKTLKGEFSLVLTNPPFGSKIVAISGDNRYTFDLAYRWAFDKSRKRFIKTKELTTNTPPQVLFVERCLSLLKTGGRLGIVLPESAISAANYRHVVQYILDNAKPVAVIGMPESLFKTSGKSGTHTKVCLVVLEKGASSPDDRIFMAEAKWCGIDSRGKEIPNNDIPTILSNFHALKARKKVPQSTLGYWVRVGDLKGFSLSPRLYNPTSTALLDDLRESHDFYVMGDLIKKGFISISTGDEIGKLAYGTGEIPFVRTSDISNWEIKTDPKHIVSREVYKKYAAKQDVREGDILFVRDGTYLIGSCAMISKYDTDILYQSHIIKIRVNPSCPFDNFLMLAVLSSVPVVAQIRALSFTQDIIDSIGHRFLEIVLPIPKSRERQEQISRMVQNALKIRVEARELTREARLAVASQLDNPDVLV